MPADATKKLTTIYKKLFAAFGPQYWWPGTTPFEIAVGAILTQNTNWSNVECAINNLKKSKCLSASQVKKLPAKKLARLIRPTGYFNVKARRLKNFATFLFDEYQGSFKRMGAERLSVLREKLLSVNGIGPETADSILLYALKKPIFVVDAYTKRLLIRHYLIKENADYQLMQDLFMRHIPRRVQLYNEYHALIVCLAKEFCKTKALCVNCPLRTIQPHA